VSEQECFFGGVIVGLFVASIVYLFYMYKGDNWFKDEAVKRGKAEYYINTENGFRKEWRWLP